MEEYVSEIAFIAYTKRIQPSPWRTIARARKTRMPARRVNPDVCPRVCVHVCVHNRLRNGNARRELCGVVSAESCRRYDTFSPLLAEDIACRGVDRCSRCFSAHRQTHAQKLIQQLRRPRNLRIDRARSKKFTGGSLFARKWIRRDRPKRDNYRDLCRGLNGAPARVYLLYQFDSVFGEDCLPRTSYWIFDRERVVGCSKRRK